jgi:hypothetical protein
MVQFPFKDNSGFEVPFPAHGRRIMRGGTKRGQSSGGTSSSIPNGKEDGVEEDTGGNTRAFLPHLSRDHGQDSSPSLIKSSMDIRSSSSNVPGSTRMNMLGWLWSSDKSAMSGGGSYRKGNTSARSIDLDYDDSDLEVIQSSEQSIADAAIQTRRSYGFRQEISRLRLALFILLAIILGKQTKFTRFS